ncbi:MAG: hypothetical protein FWH44_03735 [Methanomassiliicoccaceae archaeon]|nr:hypothetical protein [Methanomassiliicoccaceae archaeon]
MAAKEKYVTVVVCPWCGNILQDPEAPVFDKRTVCEVCGTTLSFKWDSLLVPERSLGMKNKNKDKTVDEGNPYY